MDCSYIFTSFLSSIQKYPLISFQTPFITVSTLLLGSLSRIFFWRRKWQPTPVFLPGKSHGQRSLAGYSPWDSPGKNTGVGCHFLLQGIFLTQDLNLCLLCLPHCNWILYPLSHQGSWDLNSPTRDWTQVPCIGWHILNHWITTGLIRNKVERQLKKMTKLSAFIRSRNKLCCILPQAGPHVVN